MAYHVDSRNLNRMHINIREQYEVKVWCCLFNCTKKQLKSTVELVGSSAGAVIKHLKQELNT